jgi:hypothetical protein
VAIGVARLGIQVGNLESVHCSKIPSPWNGITQTGLSFR